MGFENQCETHPKFEAVLEEGELERGSRRSRIRRFGSAGFDFNDSRTLSNTARSLKQSF